MLLVWIKVIAMLMDLISPLYEVKNNNDDRKKEQHE